MSLHPVRSRRGRGAAGKRAKGAHVRGGPFAAGTAAAVVRPPARTAGWAGGSGPRGSPPGAESPVRPGEARPVVRADGGSGRCRTACPSGAACAGTLRVPPVTGAAGLSRARAALPLRAARTRLTRAWSSPGRGR
ncbi:hypothetical protein GCM10010287_56000 [Streptomyces variabilis]|uniref:Uncharacterized protein n=1 Tax=Streptomyces variabilis TaxID=67372 RepID=A0ABQ2U7Y0_9ACTN|nr:hypothetical protein GCM10010265_52780 [Streptomyces griseoincarnatus]GGT74391.1 hypothetical protein GCM10010287_56000 [Streptomyces variabilis]